LNEVDYKEEVFSTTNTKVAATLLTFGFSLHRMLPVEWNDVWLNQKSYVRQDRPKAQISFNFEGEHQQFTAVINSYNDEHALDNFGEALDQAGLSEDQKQVVGAAHSQALGQTCRRVLEHREWLIKLVRSMPEDAKWDVVHGEGAGIFSKFGKRSSDQFKAEMLNNL
jgi:hypothetical protein